MFIDTIETHTEIHKLTVDSEFIIISLIKIIGVFIYESCILTLMET